jgi:hypothetical protein
MTVDTYIEQARTRVRVEQEAIDEKVDAYETFLRRVSELRAERTPSTVAGSTPAGGTSLLSRDAAGTDRCRTVRTAFAETIRPQSVTDVEGSEAVLETIREEFTDSIAIALAPATEASFTPELKQLILAEAQSRRAEAVAVQKTLEREATQLEDAATTADDVIAWITAANETPLIDLSFEALRRRYETLASHRDCCETLARDRQEFLHATTNHDSDTGVSHRSFVPYLYQEFPVDHPVLATVASLDETCRECQRAVRGHLARRV